MQPLSYSEIRELVLMVFKVIVFSKRNDKALDLEINNTWEKFRPEFNKRYQSFIAPIIKNSYISYGLEGSRINLDQDLSIPLNANAFLDVFQGIEPCTIPSSFDDYIIALKKVYKRILQVEKKDSKTYSLPSNLPNFPKCFKDVNYWDKISQNPKLQELYEKIGNDKYRWTGSKSLLAGFAFRLLHKGKLKDSIKSGQQLAKIFCPYFGKDFDDHDDRTFKMERAKEEYFLWID